MRSPRSEPGASGEGVKRHQDVASLASTRALGNRHPTSALARLRAIVASFGGELHGTYALLPGLSKDPDSRSCKISAYGDRLIVHSFSGDDWRALRDHYGLGQDRPEPAPPTPIKPPQARPSRRVLDLLKTATTPDLVPDVVAYLKSRHLWPLPPDCALKAHASAAYWEAGDPPRIVGKYPALLAEVRDINHQIVTAQLTYIKDGRKLEGRAPRKTLGETSGRVGCAVRLFPIGPVLGVAEGIETAIAATRLLRIPVWSALSCALLGRFQPPSHVGRLIIAADRDVAGLTAAWNLRDRLDLPMELRLPRGPDFAEDIA